MMTSNRGCWKNNYATKSSHKLFSLKSWIILYWSFLEHNKMILVVCHSTECRHCLYWGMIIKKIIKQYYLVTIIYHGYKNIRP